MSLIRRLLGREEEGDMDREERTERGTGEPQPEPTWRVTDPDAPTEQTDLPWTGSADYRKAHQIIKNAYGIEQPSPALAGEGDSAPLAPSWARESGEQVLAEPRPADPIVDSGVHLIAPVAPTQTNDDAERCEHCGGKMPDDHELLTEVLGWIAPVGDVLTRRFYQELFRARPELRELFPEVIEQQEEKLLSAIVALLKLFKAGDNEMEQLDSALAKFGRSHTRFDPAATIEEYAAVWTVLDAVAGEMLVEAGEPVTSRHQAALRRAYEYAAGKMLAAQATARFSGRGRRRRTS